LSGSATGRTRLAALIRATTALDAVTKREWLRILPYLKPEDQYRLEQVLLGEDAEMLAAPADAEHDR
jgi:hypothetical protein